MSNEIVPNKKSFCCDADVKLLGRYGGKEQHEYCVRCNKRQDPENGHRTVANVHGKEIETTEHEDGRKDVKIGVNILDIDEKDPESLKAKETIEKEIIPKLQNRIVTAVLVHKPTNESTSTKIRLPRVREWAEFAVTQFARQSLKTPTSVSPNDFVVVEVDHDTGDARVSSLEKYGK